MKYGLGSVWHIEHWRGDILIAETEQENICPSEYITHCLDIVHSGGTQVTTWYVLLFSTNTTPAAGNTYASKGNTESTDYSESTRPTWDEAGVSALSITNSASKASFTMGGSDTTIYGAALASLSTKGDSAGGGVIGPIVMFAAAMTDIVSGDILKVSITITGSSV